MAKKLYTTTLMLKEYKTNMGMLTFINKDIGFVGMIPVFSNKKKADKFAKFHNAEINNIIEYKEQLSGKKR